MSEYNEYAVWIHIERVDEDGECIEGDSYHEPRKAASVETLGEAEAIRDMLIDLAENP